MTVRDNEWQQVTANDNERQQTAASGTMNENDTVHFKEWMTVINTKTDTLLQGMDGCN